jgi:superoxide dismutase, Fe-Mn family
MSIITNKDIATTIRQSMNLDNESTTINESYVAQVKTFNLSTELLSNANKATHIELYESYVDNFNQVSAKLDTANRDLAGKSNSDFRSLKIDETYNMNAAYLHELYFSNISDPHSEIAMDSISYMRLSRDFGTFDDWQKDFIACCLSSQNGWACTVYNTWLQSYQNCIIDLHSTNVPIGVIPIIVMDAWEHAYARDYLNKVKTYTTAMMKQFDWNVIESRFKKAERIAQVLRT